MKRCPHCGRESTDDVKRCNECGRGFKNFGDEQIGIPQIAEEKPSCEPPISSGTKWYLYGTAWGAVMLFTLATSPADLLGAYAFPVGLLGVLPIEKAIVAAWLAGLAAVAVGWVIYIILTFVMFSAKRPNVFWRAYVVFCILLALNFVGCRRIVDAAAGIH